MSFEFTTTTKAKLASVNIRSEKHGAELVPAADPSNPKRTSSFHYVDN